MKIYKVDYQNRKILVEIPLTQPTGKIRIKKRKHYTDFGIPVATKRIPFDEKMYVEWQISYDVEINSKNFENSTLKECKNFILESDNGKKKIPYELSEYLYYFYKMNVISIKDICDVKKFIKNISKDKLLENLYKICKSYPIKKEINNICFLESEIKYPHLIHDFNNGFQIIAEITIREKQKAVGIQPMLYICFPISYLSDKSGNSLIGRTAKDNEYAIFEFNKNNAFVILETIKIFGFLSERHKNDILKILNLILANKTC